ncbi:hypothetical protein PCC9214_02392 [Planktothrix tepida]|uniref:Uncharacterized protein n=2 Tax=Planktothrix TaxID=54304 RepID=A0A1J1LHB6_9CYAN|nr:MULTISPECIES: hypothetical protein [Planktothrix]CAD5948386.1 hypothetical protein PCC9214_02392 [Planktothrix tepida]CAD5962398.1 hypothetical protein NO713_03285 [Planktothrix pseudagardhii]CUR31911.1 hypothetical protein PL921430050 [Planktothrix tepida PCC 9214]
MINTSLFKGAKPRNLQKNSFYQILSQKLFSLVLFRPFIFLSLLQGLALVELITFLASNHNQPNVGSEQPITVKIVSTSEPKNPVKISNFKANELFLTPNSLGVIAIGLAEGTRTVQGGFTPQYFGHRDSGNAALNLGTFAYQHEASSPLEADLKQIKKLRKSTERLQQEAQLKNLRLGLFELLAGIDLINQSPAAGNAYISSLQDCKTQYLLEYDVVLCARIQSYRNPDTGEIEAAGFNNDLEQLKQDQQRRLQKISIVLSQHNLEPAQN